MAKEIETLPPQQFTLLIESRISDLEYALKLQNQNIKKAPPGKIRIVHNKGQLQFYLREHASDLQGKYLPRSKEKLVRALIQKDYNQKSVEAMGEELNFLKDFLLSYQKKAAASAYDNLLPARQSLSTPVTLPDSHYAEKWLSVEYKHKSLETQIAPLFTDNNEQVRSKSEVLIANALYAKKVPYRYEFPLIMHKDFSDYDDSDMCTFHPDFYCLNLRTRREFVWEHFGMMDDPDYAARAAEKIIIYQQNGYFPGKNLIISMETSNYPLSSNVIKKIIDFYLI